MRDISKILAFGPRSLKRPGHQKIIEFIVREMQKNSAEVTLQKGNYRDVYGNDYPITNIIARVNPENPRKIIIGTHYDSIIRAYADLKNPDGIMPGANNSASGVALLLETARLLGESKKTDTGIDFVFFDGEEGVKSLGAGDPDWFPLGSPYFAGHLPDFYKKEKPLQGIIFDMVCDNDLDLHPEENSLRFANSQVQDFWKIGRKVAPSSFPSTPTFAINDDQNALITAGIPAFLVIDFSYSPWFNTTGDTIDKCSPVSLQAVGFTLFQYLYTIH